MRKYSLLLAVMLAASFSTVADAAKKKAASTAPKDPVHEWNAKNIPPMQMPMAAPAATPDKAAKKTKKAKGSKKKSKAA